MKFVIHELRKLKGKAFRSLRIKLSLFILILLVITTFVFYIFTVQMMDRYILNELIKRAESVSRSVAASASHSILLEDFLGIDNIVHQLKTLHRDVEYIAVVDTDMRVIAHTDIEKRGDIVKPAIGRMLKEGKNGMVVNEISSQANNYFEVVTPFTFQDKQLGKILLGVNKSVLINAREKAYGRILAGFAVTLLLGIIGIFIVSHFITRPIQELSPGIEKLRDGKRN